MALRGRCPRRGAGRGSACGSSTRRRCAFLGKTAIAPIPAGAVLAQGQFTDGSALQLGQAMATVLLAPGTVPASLAPGDRVELIKVAGSNPTGADSGGTTLTTATVVS